MKFSVSKKSILSIMSAAAVVILVAAGAFAFLNSGIMNGISLNDNEALEKAKAVSNAVWFVENLDYTEHDLVSGIETLKEYCFDTVFVKPAAVSKTGNLVKNKKKTEYKNFTNEKKIDDKDADFLRTVVEQIDKSGLNVIVCADVMSYDSIISQLASMPGCDGLVITGCSNHDADFVNRRLADITGVVRSHNQNGVVYAQFDEIKNPESIAFDNTHMTYCVASAETDVASLNAVLEATQVGLIAQFRCDRICNSSYSDNADELLRQIISTDVLSKLFGRSFYSLSDFISDRDKSTSVAVEYIKSGINTEKALKEISFVGLESEQSETPEEFFKFTINCSDKYSLYINDYNYGSVGKEMCDIDINLRHGKNVIRIYQNGRTIEHTVVCTKEFTGDYVTFISPDEDMLYNGGTVLDITAGAYYGAELYAVIGDERIKMKSIRDSYGDYTVFSCSYKLPKARRQSRNIGTVIIEATVNGNTKKYSGGSITVNGKGQETTQSSQQVVLPQENTVRPPVQSIVGTGKNMTPYSYNGVSGNSDFVIVTSPFAETRPMENNNSYYNPNYNSWTQGTIDYVVGESSYTNGDGDTFHMYDLATGRRVVKEDVAFIPRGYNLPLNSIKVLSSNCNKGLSIKLDTDWCIPYAVNYYNQDYYAGYENKPFNIRNYTVSVVDFVFYYTSSAKGTVDVGDNEIVASTEWINEKDYSILRCYLKKQGGFYGYKITYDENGNLDIKFKERGKSLSDTVIVIDPGHGGSDPGALGMNGTVYESGQTLKISTYLANYLIQNGAKVYMTRTSNSTVELYDRRNMAEQVDPDLYVSVHLNSAKNKSLSGTSTFYYTSFSKPLAQCIHNRLVSAYSTSCYQNNPQMMNGLDDGTSFYPFYVTRTESFPSVLIETGYISNDYECAFLTDDAYQQVFAYAIFCGIADYVSMN